MNFTVILPYKHLSLNLYTWIGDALAVIYKASYSDIAAYYEIWARLGYEVMNECKYEKYMLLMFYSWPYNDNCLCV